MFAILLTLLLLMPHWGDEKVDSIFFQKLTCFSANILKTPVLIIRASEKIPSWLIKLVAAISAFDFKNAVKNRKMAFWINAYNILVIQSVVNNYPLKSPLDVKGFFDTRQHLTGGAKLTLNEIENKKLREKFGDARIHLCWSVPHKVIRQ
ncbi:MAG: DUF547 domain-containing protein [Caldithrix sp.]|nr:MAG: DUF547 domain-containing protein [Caldithrix sp.]